MHSDHIAGFKGAGSICHRDRGINLWFVSVATEGRHLIWQEGEQLILFFVSLPSPMSLSETINTGRHPLPPFRAPLSSKAFRKPDILLLHSGKPLVGTIINNTNCRSVGIL